MGAAGLDGRTALSGGPPNGDARVLDCCVFNDWQTQFEVTDYMSRGWRNYLGQPGSTAEAGIGGKSIEVASPYHHPAGDLRSNFSSALNAGPGSDYPKVVSDLFASGTQHDRAVLVPLRGLLIPADNNAALGAELCVAVNRWTTDRWLSGPDRRLRGSILVQAQLPQKAAAEIHRAAKHPGMVQVVLSASGLSKPFGHRIFQPIFRAAAAEGLPIAIHAGGDVTADALSHPTGGGLPSTYSEMRALSAQPLMTHLVSIVSQGVFEEFKDLRVLLIGGGVTWVPGFLWRFDNCIASFGWEAPWLTKTASEYVRSNVLVSTWPLEHAPTADQLRKFLGACEGIENILCFASGYPEQEYDPPAVVDRLAEGWRTKVLHANALGAYGRRLA